MLLRSWLSRFILHVFLLHINCSLCPLLTATYHSNLMQAMFMHGHPVCAIFSDHTDAEEIGIVIVWLSGLKVIVFIGSSTPPGSDFLFQFYTFLLVRIKWVSRSNLHITLQIMLSLSGVCSLLIYQVIEVFLFCGFCLKCDFPCVDCFPPFCRGFHVTF